MQKSNIFWALAVCFVFLSPLTAQNQPSNPSPSSKSNRQFEERVLDLVVPNTLIVEGRDTKVAPLTVGQKFGQVGKNFFNPFVFLGAGFEAGTDQAFDVHQGYGQGANGYGKRYGANIADTATNQFFGVGVYPSIFHTDPRYYRVGSGGVFSRGWYAATRVFVTRTDSGRNIFNAPEILASATTSGISRSYYPSDERTAGDFAYSMGSRIAFDAAYNLAKEFWPDVRRKLFGH
jgi:hypothetical protein